MSASPKLCKDCRHFHPAHRHVWMMDWDEVKFGQYLAINSDCSAVMPDVFMGIKPQIEPFLMNGDPVRAWTNNAFGVRQGPCGIPGYLWEPKDA